MISSIELATNYVWKRYLKFKSKNACKLPMLIGISGLQGSGKSTITKNLYTCLTASPYNLKTAILSLDDFYLTYNDQLQLSKSLPISKLFEFRGNPGTHDLDLLYDTLEKLSMKEENTVKVPLYNKYLHQGKGDRVAKEEWMEFKTPVDLILIEGWMLGFKGREVEEVENIIKNQKGDEVLLNQLKTGYNSAEYRKYQLEELIQLNTNLNGYQKLFHQIDDFIVLKGKKLEFVFDWREQQERNGEKKKEDGLNKDQVRQFVQRFLPAYELYLNDFYDKVKPALVLELDENRNVLNYYD
ncbi:P-loop containing nucleoside triphosphate hydrolase protein [Neoconidiobolus thromboides FSU 785]|nr:P-loop containing nucleoside triphosphate hydrolase protein [Neoconidiobolus thromboides FSU 785]